MRVGGYHTYFVGGEGWGFSAWAHNDDACVGDGPDSPEMQADEAEAPKGDTQSIYKAPGIGKGQKQLAEGYHPDDFPATGGGDGKAYFAKEKSLADDYAYNYGEGVIEVQVPKDVYDARLRQYEQPYQGGPQTELPIPYKEFDVLNNSPRKLHP